MTRFGEGLYDDDATTATATLEASEAEYDAEGAEYRAERDAYLGALAEAAAPVAPAAAPVPGRAGEAGRLTIDQFDLATHDAVITIHNTATGGHRTFKVETLRGDWNPGKRALSILDGPSNTTDYKRFAWVEGGTVKLWTRFRPAAGEGPNAWEKYARMVERPARYTGRGVEYLIAGKCRRCGRRLTTARSVKSGIGPTCEGLSAN
jgi:hypothetical protein